MKLGNKCANISSLFPRLGMTREKWTLNTFIYQLCKGDAITAEQRGDERCPGSQGMEETSYRCSEMFTTTYLGIGEPEDTPKICHTIPSPATFKKHILVANLSWYRAWIAAKLLWADVICNITPIKSGMASIGLVIMDEMYFELRLKSTHPWAVLHMFGDRSLLIQRLDCSRATWSWCGMALIGQIEHRTTTLRENNYITWIDYRSCWPPILKSDQCIYSPDHSKIQIHVIRLVLGNVARWNRSRF